MRRVANRRSAVYSIAVIRGILTAAAFSALMFGAGTARAKGGVEVKSAVNGEKEASSSVSKKALSKPAPAGKLSEAEYRAAMKKKLGKEEYLKWLKQRIVKEKEKQENEAEKPPEKQKPDREGLAEAAGRAEPAAVAPAARASASAVPAPNAGTPPAVSPSRAPSRPWTKPEDFAVEGVEVGDAGGGGGAPRSESAPELERRSEAALNSALGGSSMLRGWDRDAGDVPPSNLKNPRPPPDGGPGPAGGPGAPATERELIASSYSGFSASFKKVGLRVGADAQGRARIEDAGGRPASPERLAALRAQIDSEPRALLTRPDFFQVIPRSRFNALKSAYRASPQLRSTAFQDIGAASGGRDFAWTRSCHRLSGGCNPASAEARYERGEFVSPETLEGVYERVEESDAASLDADEDDDLDWLDEDWDDYTEEEEAMADAADRARERLSGSVLTRAAGALKGLLGRAGRIFGGGPFFASGEVPESSAVSEAEDFAAGGVPPAAGGEAAGAGPGTGSSPRFSAPVPARGRSPARPRGEKERPPPSGRALLYLACAAGAAGFFLLAFARRG